MKKTIADTNHDPDDRREIVRAEQSRKTESTLSREISDAYRQFQDAAQDVVELALSLENRRIKLGVLLQAAKAQLGHGHFLKFIETSIPFSGRTARNFMNYADAAGGKELENLDSLRAYNSLLIEWGLKQPPQGHGAQTLHDAPNFFITITKTLGQCRKVMADAFESRPLDAWSPDEKQQLREQIAPVVEFYNKL
jgi:hypothetical protein